MITVQGLSYSYVNQKPISFQDFTIQKGEHCLLLGNSGSGKTTLLHLIGGLLSSQQGSIEIEGTEITQLPEVRMDHFRGQRMGFIFQRNHLISALTVKKNLMLASYFAGMKPDEGRLDRVLNELELAGKKDARISELSQGQAQRVAIARAVLNKPSVILADEPTSALDDSNCKKVMELLTRASAQNNATLLIATHDQRLKNEIPNLIQL